MSDIPNCLKELRSILQNDSRLIIDLPEGFQRAAVLIPLIYRENGWTIVFTRRTETVRHHKKEISFPGGRHEDPDRDLIHTALREIQEEVGIQKIHVIGLLDDLLTISKYVVTPVVGFVEDNSEVDQNQINVPEIDYVLEVPISDLVISEHFSIKEMTYQESFKFQVPFFDYCGEIIWGATGRILVTLLKKFNLLNPECRLKLMKQDLWTENGAVDDGLDYLDNVQGFFKKD